MPQFVHYDTPLFFKAACPYRQGYAPNPQYVRCLPRQIKNQLIKTNHSSCLLSWLYSVEINLFNETTCLRPILPRPITSGIGWKNRLTRLFDALSFPPCPTQRKNIGQPTGQPPPAKRSKKKKRPCRNVNFRYDSLILNKNSSVSIMFESTLAPIAISAQIFMQSSEIRTINSTSLRIDPTGIYS